jgi:hypothetical protein
MKSNLIKIILTAIAACLLVPLAFAVQTHSANEIRGGFFNVTAPFIFPDITNVYFDDKVIVNKTIASNTNPNITFVTGIEIPGSLRIRGNYFANRPLVDLVQDYNRTYFINKTLKKLENDSGIQTPDEIDFTNRFAHVYFTTDNANTISPRISMNFSEGDDQILFYTPTEVYNWMRPSDAFFVQQNVPIVLENVKLLPDHALCFNYKNDTDPPTENSSRYIGYCNNINATTGACNCTDIIV